MYKKLLSFASLAAMLMATQSAKAEDIVISPTSGAEISAALTTATDGKTVESITINLEKGGAYTITGSLVTPNSLIINGNGATIDASGLAEAFIKMDATPGVAANSLGYFEIANITVKDININDIKERMFYDNGKKYVIMNFMVDNCVLKLNHDATVANFFDLNGGGANEFTIQNSTVYQTGTANITYFTKYNNGAVPDKAIPEWTASKFWTYKNNTFYKVGTGQWHNGGRIANKATGMTVEIDNNIWIDCATGGGGILRRIFAGKNTTNFAAATVAYNTYWLNGAKEDNSGYDKTNPSTVIETAPTFADAENGDFTIAASDAQYTNKTGDPRWLSETITTAASGYTTLVSKLALDFTSATGLEAYIAKSVDDVNKVVTIEPITSAPAGTPVILKGSASTEYIIKTTTTPDEVTGNILQGSATESTELAANAAYILVGGKFVKNNAGTMPAGKAYLNVPTDAPSLDIVFGGGTTGINDVRSKMADVRGEVYNLAGQRVAQPTKGFYVVNGKKVIIK